MATEIVGEKRGGKGSIKKGDQQQLLFTESYEFLVLCSDKDTTREEVLLDTPGLPVVNITQLPSGAICVSKEATRLEENPYYWTVSCEFETQPIDQENQEDNPDPTTWTALMKIGFETKEKVLQFDANKDAIVNSAKQKFETPLTITQSIPVIRWFQYEWPWLELSEILARNNTVNSASKFGAGAKTLLCNVLSAERGYYYRFPAWKIEYQLRYDKDTWQVKMLDVGTRFWNGFKYEIYYEDNVRIVGNLDGKGNKSANNGEDPPAELPFDIYDEDDFSWIRAR